MPQNKLGFGLSVPYEMWADKTHSTCTFILVDFSGSHSKRNIKTPQCHLPRCCCVLQFHENSL